MPFILHENYPLRLQAVPRDVHDGVSMLRLLSVDRLQTDDLAVLLSAAREPFWGRNWWVVPTLAVAIITLAFLDMNGGPWVTIIVRSLL